MSADAQAVARQGLAAEATMACLSSWHWQVKSTRLQPVSPAAATKQPICSGELARQSIRKR